jgi:hypothetical protein
MALNTVVILDEIEPPARTDHDMEGGEECQSSQANP